MRYCTTNSYKLILAGVPGLEPGMAVLETVVIPLHYTPIKANFSRKTPPMKRGRELLKKSFGSGSSKPKHVYGSTRIVNLCRLDSCEFCEEKTQVRRKDAIFHNTVPNVIADFHIANSRIQLSKGQGNFFFGKHSDVSQNRFGDDHLMWIFFGVIAVALANGSDIGGGSVKKYGAAVAPAPVSSFKLALAPK